MVKRHCCTSCRDVRSTLHLLQSDDLITYYRNAGDLSVQVELVEDLCAVHDDDNVELELDLLNVPVSKPSWKHRGFISIEVSAIIDLDTYTALDLYSAI
jgi:hypothetical protein